jgi:CheY-like chemotaxis protein
MKIITILREKLKRVWAKGNREVHERMPHDKRWEDTREESPLWNGSYAVPLSSQILIVEDRFDDAEWLRKQLERVCISNPSYVVTNAEEALAYIDGQGKYGDRRCYPFPKILLLDWRLPGMSGFELLGAIRRRPECKEILTITLSGLDDVKYVRRGWLAGAAAFIQKPCLPADLAGLIQRFPAYWEHSEKQQMAAGA